MPFIGEYEECSTFKASAEALISLNLWDNDGHTPVLFSPVLFNVFTLVAYFHPVLNFICSYL